MTTTTRPSQREPIDPMQHISVPLAQAIKELLQRANVAGVVEAESTKEAQ